MYAPWPADFQRQKDEHDLKLLSILFFCYGGLVALASLLFLVYVGIGALMIAEPGASASPADVRVLTITGSVLAVVFGILFLIVLAKGILLFVAGAGLRSRKRYWLAVVLAGISCMNVPLGTALGVFGLIVLLRPSVKASFAT